MKPQWYVGILVSWNWEPSGENYEKMRISVRIHVWTRTTKSGQYVLLRPNPLGAPHAGCELLEIIDFLKFSMNELAHQISI